MEIPVEYERLYSRIIQPSIFIQEKWYPMPKDVFTHSFLMWYYKQTLCVEFSEDKRHFMVVGYPAKYIQNDYKISE